MRNKHCILFSSDIGGNNMKFKIGDRVRIEWQEEDFDTGSLVGEIGTIVKYGIKEWHNGDLILNLDCGITDIVYSSELLTKVG